MGPTLIRGMLALALCAWAPVLVADKKISKELAEMYRQDQDDQNNWAELGDEEASRRQDARRERAAEIVKAGLLEKPIDYYHASMLFQHGNGADDHLLAHILSSAASMEGQKVGFFMSAAALDRFLMHLGKPQRFGSQFNDEMGTDLGDTSALLSEAIVQVFRDSEPYPRSGLTGRALDEEARSKKNLRAAAKELAKLAKSATRSFDSSGSNSHAELKSMCTRVMEIIDAGQLDKPDDFYNAAVVLVCGEDSDQLICAHACSTAASLLGHKLGRDLYPITLDACMRSLKRAPVFDNVYTAAKDPERPELLELHANVRAVFGLRTGKKR